MTTYVDFQLSPLAPFQFQATLDGDVYTVVVTWNLYAQRWYVNILSLAGALIVAQAMVGSPPGYNISLTAGYFATMLVWRTANNQFEII